MLRYIIQRLLQIIPVVLVVLSLNFLLIHLAPGDPARIMGGEYATGDQIEQIRIQYGLDKPITTQFVQYFAHLFRGDLGYSYNYKEPVFSVIRQRLPAEILLVLSSQVLGVFIGNLLAVLAARARGSKFDVALVMGSTFAYSLPVFWLGLMLILLFSIKLHWLPTSGMRSVLGPESGLPMIADVLKHLLLPAVSLAVVWVMPLHFRITRVSMLEVLSQDYVRTARAKGIPETTVLLRHALRNALLPSTTMVGLTIGLALSGGLLTETVFGWPGIGRLMYEGIFQRDYPLLMGIFLITALVVVVAQLITDVLYVFLDPRVTLA